MSKKPDVSERGAADGGMTAGVSRYSSTDEVNPPRSETSRFWLVTLLDRGHEITLEVDARTKELARREVRHLHPNGHIVHVERA